MPRSIWLLDIITVPARAVGRANRIAADRASLPELPAERLADMGISRRAAVDEARRPFWDTSTR